MKRTKKTLSFLILIFILFNITLNLNSQHAYAVGVLENYINQSTSTQMSDEALKDLFGQTGYKVGTQAEIDSLRNKAKMETPELFNKYPLFFGVSQDSFPVSEDAPGMQEYIKNMDGHTTVVGKIGADLRAWVNKTIDTLETKSDLPSVSDNVSGDGKIGSIIAPKLSFSASDWTGTRTYDFNVDSRWKFVDTWTNKWTEMSGGRLRYFVAVGVVMYDSNYAQIGCTTLASNPSWDGYLVPSISCISGLDTVIYPNNKTNYVPYPTTQTEVASQPKVPTEISMPVKVGQDGLVTPDITPLPFPSTRVFPLSVGGDVAVGPAIITYADPTVDPTTGQVIDPIVTPTVDPTIDPTKNPADPTKDPSFPTSVPTDHIDFTPLINSTMKFPFSIPWDLLDLIKILNAKSEAPHIKFNDVTFDAKGFNTTFTIPMFEFNLADLPMVDKIVSILRYFEILLFIGFLIVKTRDFIRG